MLAVCRVCAARLKGAGVGTKARAAGGACLHGGDRCLGGDVGGEVAVVGCDWVRGT